jgi:peptidoglycan/LPS O-acetylase OafA/YrhL
VAQSGQAAIEEQVPGSALPERPPDAVTPPPGNPRFPLFDGLRALAALSILVYHTGTLSRAGEGEAGLSPYLARLNVGVAIFFVISGFLLYRPFLAARAGSSPRLRWRDYARRRVLRIVPAYWVALTVLAIYPGLPGMFGAHWWVYYAFGQDYSQSTVIQGLGPAWSLGCEVVFYALLPLIAAGMAHLAAWRGRRFSWILELSVLFCLSLLSGGWRAYVDSHLGTPTSTFASTFAWFALGMALAVVNFELSRRPRALERVARYAWLGWVVAPVAYVAMCRGLGLSSAFVFAQKTTVAQDLGVYALSGVLAAALAVPAAFARSPSGAVNRILSARPVAWLGLISYGVFLYHFPIAQKLNGGYTTGGDATVRFVWLTAATAALAVIAGALSYYVIERPLLHLKERRVRSPRAVEVAR